MSRPIKISVGLFHLLKDIPAFLAAKPSIRFIKSSNEDTEEQTESCRNIFPALNLTSVMQALSLNTFQTACYLTAINNTYMDSNLNCALSDYLS